MKRNCILPTVGKIAAAVAIFLTTPNHSDAQVRPAIVRDADQPARQPVVISGFTGSFGFTGKVDLDICVGPASCSKTVPAGKRLVIESVSITCTTNGSTLLHAKIFTTLHQVLRATYFNLPRIVSLPASMYHADAKAVRIYVDAGSTVELELQKDGGTGTAQATAFGYLVDLN